MFNVILYARFLLSPGHYFNKPLMDSCEARIKHGVQKWGRGGGGGGRRAERTAKTKEKKKDRCRGRMNKT